MGTEIQQNRYDQLLRRVGGLLGPGAKVAEVLAELFPMFDVENLPAELYLLGGTRLGHGGSQITGNAGEFPRIQLINPIGSNLIATVTSVLLSASATVTLRWSEVNDVFTTDTNRQRNRDSRLGLAQEPTCTIRTESNPVNIGVTGEVVILQNEPLLITDPDGLAVLSPGVGLAYANGTVATALRVNFYWRERVAERSELNL